MGSISNLFNFIETLGKSFRVRLFLFIFLIYIAGATLDVTNTNPGSRFMLTKAIAKYGEFTIRQEDLERYSYLDYAEYNGSIFSDKPPGISLLTVPIYWIGEFIALNFFGMDPANHFAIDDLIKFLIIIVALIWGAFTSIKFYDLLRLLGIGHKSANWTTLTFAFGSLFYVYIGTLFSHGFTASFLLLAVYFLTKFRDTMEISALAWAGLYSGLMMTCDYVLVVVQPFLLAYLLIPFPWNLRELIFHWKAYFRIFIPRIVIFLFPILLNGLLILYYNFSCFNDPFKTPYSYAKYFWDKQHFANPILEGLEVLVFSRHHGLLNFMPILLLTVIGLIILLNKKPVLAILCLTVPLVFILLYSKYFLPTGGLAYGPRHIVSISPLLLIPIAYIFDLREDQIPLGQKIFSKVLKFLAIILSFFSIIINVAGGWVGVYPLGGEGMVDPIWGIPGHVSTLLSWFSLNFDFPARISIEFLQGHYSGGFKFNLLIASFQVFLTWPSASSLSRGEPTAFFAALALAFLLNPYWNPLNSGKAVNERFKKIKIPPRILLLSAIGLEGFLASCLTVWFLLDISVLLNLPFSEIIVGVQSYLHSHTYVGFFLLEYLNKIIIFVINALLNFFFLRPHFSLAEWMFRVIFFVSVTLIVWNPMREVKKEKILSHFDNSPLIQLYLRFASFLSIIYLLSGVILLPLMLQSLNLFSIVTQIFYYVIFLLTLELAFTPYKQQIERSQKIVVEDKEKSQHPDLEDTILSLSSFILLILLIVGFMLNLTFSEQKVTVFLLIALIIAFYALSIPIYRYLANKSLIPKNLVNYSPSRKEMTIFQSVLILGGGFVTFIFLLIRILYKTLSTVPDTSILQTYPEEEIILLVLLIGMLISLGISFIQYIRIITKKNTIQLT
ncbi:MAG: hypothetical protein EAX86_05930 [Candidatus Heimdallarchaeota archaeon]|nr:hypothetical protein [Candidatus Heimdallarchaeota archaeon]